MSETIARLQVSPGRRMAGVIVLALIGVVLIYSAAVYPPDAMLGRLAVLLLAVLVLLQAWWNFSARSGALILKQDGVWIEDGPRLVALDNVVAVQASPFAIKPSNGFAIVLERPLPAKWVPGLYWCVGRRIGVGGATNPAQTKAMAELLSTLIVGR